MVLYDFNGGVENQLTVRKGEDDSRGIAGRGGGVFTAGVWRNMVLVVFPDQFQWPRCVLVLPLKRTLYS